MTARLLAAIDQAEPLLAAAVIGVGAELHAPATGLLAFGLCWYLPLLVDRIRGRA